MSCSVAGCEKPVRARGWCNSHYLRWRRCGDPLGLRGSYEPRTGTCIIDGCDRPIEGRRLCKKHWFRLKRHGDPEEGGTAWGEPQRFLDEVASTHIGTECLLWPFARNGAGYAMCGDKLAHRIVCEQQHGKPPTPEHEAAHSCGKGHLGCISRQHLGWKTRKENAADKITHGTSNRGERHGMNRLSETEVRSIRAMLGTMSQREIAKMFVVTPSLVSAINTRRAWGWLD